MQEVVKEKNQKEQQKKLHSFGCAKISKYFFIPLVIPIFCVAYNYVIALFAAYAQEIAKIKFYLPKIAIITRILGGSLYFLINKNNQTESQIKLLNDKITPLIYTDVEKRKFKKALKMMFIFSIFEVYILEFSFLSIDQPKFELDFRPLYLIFVVPLSYKILGKDVFLHQKISLVFSAIGLIIVIISTILYTEMIEKFNWYLMLMGFFGSIFYALVIVGHKYIMEELFISPYLLLFITGLISLFYDFSFNICYNLITGENLKNIFMNLTFLINKDSMKECIIFLVLIFVIGTIYFILVKLSLFYFSPTLLVVTDLISPIFYLFLPLIYGGFNLKYFSLSVTGYSISLISAIFYNELIVCNFFGLNKNTVENIKIRGEMESNKSLLDQDKSRNASYCSIEECNEENDEKETIN